MNFITIAGEPSQAAKNASFKKIVKSNASRLVQRERGNSGEHAGLVVATPEFRPRAGIHCTLPGRTRFALNSRKPMKKARRRTPAAKPNEPKERPPTTDLQATPHQPTPRNALVVGTSSSSWVPQTTKPNVEMMLLHLFNQLIENQHCSTRYITSNFDELYAQDQGLFHAGLCLASIYYDTGTSDLYHCQQTLKVVSRRLGDTYKQTSDETIGAVGLLVIHDTLKGSAEESALHMSGLQHMVEARGGLHRLPIRLKRTLSMIDIFYAATFDLCPRFPFVPPHRSFENTLKVLRPLSSSDFGSHTSDIECSQPLRTNEALRVLRMLTSCRFDGPKTVFKRLALSDAIYHLEWQVLCSNEPQKASPVSRFAIEMQIPFRLATLLYIDIVLREMPTLGTAGLVRRLVDSLQAFHLEGSFMGVIWSSEVDLFLWILFIGAVAAEKHTEREYFIQWLRSICLNRGYQSKAKFEEAVDRVGPGIQYFCTQNSELWDEMVKPK